MLESTAVNQISAPTPHTVTTGGKVFPALPEDPCLTMLLDFLTVSLRGTASDVRDLAKILFKGVQIEPSSRGWSGYQERENLLLKTSDGVEMTLGFLAHGGEHQRGRVCLSLTGAGCAGVQSWEPLKHEMTGRAGRITRVDIAVDNICGGRLSLPGARKSHLRGGFDTKGRRPKCSWFGNDSCAGNTLYIGSRQAGKLFRAYEKGKQLGDPESPWVRFELELHSKDRIIPLDVLSNPLPYFRGAYPYLARVVPADTPTLSIPTIKATSKISARRAIEIARRQCGGAIHRLLRAGADPAKLCRTLARESPSRRLQVWTLPEAVQKLELNLPVGRPVHRLPMLAQLAWAGPRQPAWMLMTANGLMAT